MDVEGCCCGAASIACISWPAVRKVGRLVSWNLTRASTASEYMKAALSASSRQLAEFKGVAYSIPNQAVLLNTLTLQEAKEKGPRETLLYVPAIIPDQSRPDYLATVDADPESKTYSKVPGSRGVDRRWDPCRNCMCGRRVHIKVADQGRALHSPTFLSRSSTACP